MSLPVRPPITVASPPQVHQRRSPDGDGDGDDDNNAHTMSRKFVDLLTFFNIQKRTLRWVSDARARGTRYARQPPAQLYRTCSRSRSHSLARALARALARTPPILESQLATATPARPRAGGHTCVARHPHAAWSHDPPSRIDPDERATPPLRPPPPPSRQATNAPLSPRRDEGRINAA